MWSGSTKHTAYRTDRTFILLRTFRDSASALLPLIAINAVHHSNKLIHHNETHLSRPGDRSLGLHSCGGKGVPEV